MSYAELHSISNFTFLRGASHPAELVAQAARLGYTAIAITDECSLAGVVKAHVKVKAMHQTGCPIKLIIGSEFSLPDKSKFVALVPDKLAYEELSAFISLCRIRSAKGKYQLVLHDLEIHLRHCFIIFFPHSQASLQQEKNNLQTFGNHPHVWIGVERLCNGYDESIYQHAYRIATLMNKSMVACGNVHMHCRQRKPLQDTLTAIRKNTSVQLLGKALYSNSEHYLRPIKRLRKLYPESLLKETVAIAKQCHFSLEQLRYQYPKELTPPHLSASQYLRQLVEFGVVQRWAKGISPSIRNQIEKELQIIGELQYEYFFLTVHDLVSFAKGQNILCQGRGSAANSVVCYCLFITEVDPARAELLFERFIAKERKDPPDIDVDFEHQRREEVIQYIYKKYSRERAALAATVITYRTRSAIRDVGKALGFNPQFTEQLAQSLGWWQQHKELRQRLAEVGEEISETVLDQSEISQTQGKTDRLTPIAELFLQLIDEIIGFPRHLSQHVGGFIISDGPLSRLVPIENANMPGRTVIQWDKEDIEALGLLKVDVLALGMLSAIRKTFDLANLYLDQPLSLSDIPDNDSATYDMLCNGDSIGVFQVESRAQISMLPRLRPRTFYDLVIQVAIVRPGPIQGNMVHPYLRRREGSEPVSYANQAIKNILSRTLGVPIFQEQVLKLAMIAAGFSGGEADQLRRAMASWGKNGDLLQFKGKFINGMLARNYERDFAERVFNQMKGFGSYGFPESHAASFALLVYVSSWLKRHHTTAFYAALINSQPMGFYSPSQLVQDAKRHGIDVRPIDVQQSQWDCHLEQRPSGNSSTNDYTHDATNDNKKENITPVKSTSQPTRRWALRLGFKLLKGFRQDTAIRIVNARNEHAFIDLKDLIRRAKLNDPDRTALIQADAVSMLSGNRHQSHWQNLAVDWDRIPLTSFRSPAPITQEYIKDEPPPEYTDRKHTPAQSLLNDDIFLAPPTEAQDIRADYSHTGLSLRRHPLQILRNSAPFYRCKRAKDLLHLNHGRFVQVAGIVTGRQRPGTASGVIFLTLEDESGNVNVIVWKDLQEKFQQPLLKSKLLLVKGIMERKNSVIHVIAGQLVDYSDRLDGFTLPSRDFH